MATLFDQAVKDLQRLHPDRSFPAQRLQEHAAALATAVADLQTEVDLLSPSDLDAPMAAVAAASEALNS